MATNFYLILCMCSLLFACSSSNGLVDAEATLPNTVEVSEQPDSDNNVNAEVDEQSTTEGAEVIEAPKPSFVLNLVIDDSNGIDLVKQDWPYLGGIRQEYEQTRTKILDLLNTNITSINQICNEGGTSDTQVSGLSNPTEDTIQIAQTMTYRQCHTLTENHYFYNDGVYSNNIINTGNTAIDFRSKQLATTAIRDASTGLLSGVRTDQQQNIRFTAQEVIMNWTRSLNNFFSNDPNTGQFNGLDPHYRQENVHSYTLIDLKGDVNQNVFSSGQWRIDGANDSFLIASIVSNGIEVSINNGQAVLIEWPQLPGYRQ